MAVICLRVMLFAAFHLPLSAFLLGSNPHLVGPVRDAAPPPSGRRDSVEQTAQCRATCLSQTMDWPPSNNACTENADCMKCWELCGTFFVDELQYRSKCKNQECGHGCEVACQFDFESSPVHLDPWELDTSPTLEIIDEENLKMMWSPPRSNLNTIQPYIVYTLLYYDATNPTWSPIFMTADSEATVTGYHRHLPGLAFQLMMSSTNGTVALAPIPYSKDMGKPTAPPVHTIPPWDPSMFMERVNQAEVYRPVGEDLFPASEKDSPGQISYLSVNLERLSDGSLTCEVTWDQTLKEGVDVMYVIGWGMLTCNVDDNMPHCNLEEEQSFTEVPPQQSSKMVAQLGKMVYNAKYWLDVSFSGFPAQRLHFYTPPCSMIDRTFTRCAERRTSTSASWSALPTRSTSTVHPGGQVSSTPSSRAYARTPTPDEDWAQLLREAEIMGSLPVPDEGLLSVDIILTVLLIGVGVVLVGLLCIAAHAKLSQSRSLSLKAIGRLSKSCQSVPGYLHNPGPGSQTSLHRLNMHSPLSASQNLLLHSLLFPSSNLPLTRHPGTAQQTTFSLSQPSPYPAVSGSALRMDSGFDEESDMEQIPVITIEACSDKDDMDFDDPDLDMRSSSYEFIPPLSIRGNTVVYMDAVSVNSCTEV